MRKYLIAAGLALALGGSASAQQSCHVIPATGQVFCQDLSGLFNGHPARQMQSAPITPGNQWIYHPTPFNGGAQSDDEGD